jgi:hypothetical protein
MAASGLPDERVGHTAQPEAGQRAAPVDGHDQRVGTGRRGAPVDRLVHQAVRKAELGEMSATVARGSTTPST